MQNKRDKVIELQLTKGPYLDYPGYWKCYWPSFLTLVQMVQSQTLVHLKRL